MATLLDINNKIHPTVRLNSICPYFTMFPLSFPYSVLKNAGSKDLIYDPFCGRGTTNYAARLRGLNSIGIDSNPVAYAVAQTKLLEVKPQQIVKLCFDILVHHEPNTYPIGEFWNWAYHPDTLVDICKIRDYLNRKSRLTKDEVALRAIMLGILHGPKMKTIPSYLSNQMPRTFSTKPDYSVKYWRNKKMRPEYVNVLEVIRRKSFYVFNNQTPKKVDGKIVLGDSRLASQVPYEKFDWVITSPPYFGMSSYEQDQWLRNWFMGGKDVVNYSSKLQIRHYSETAFIKDLSKVWDNAAKRSNPNAKLVIRFGALPSKSEKSPVELLKASLKDTDWKLTTVKNAGKPIESIRQANQFKNQTGNYIEEIDAFAKLN